MLYRCCVEGFLQIPSLENQKYRGNIFFKDTKAHFLDRNIFSCSCSGKTSKEMSVKVNFTLWKTIYKHLWGKKNKNLSFRFGKKL